MKKKENRDEYACDHRAGVVDRWRTDHLVEQRELALRPQRRARLGVLLILIILALTGRL